MPQVIALLERVGVDPERLQAQVQSAAVTASRYVAERALSIGQGTLRGTVFFFLMLYLLFFFLRDGPRMLEALVRALPLGDQRERHLLEPIRRGVARDDQGHARRRHRARRDRRHRIRGARASARRCFGAS